MGNSLYTEEYVEWLEAKIQDISRRGKLLQDSTDKNILDETNAEIITTVRK